MKKRAPKHFYTQEEIRYLQALYQLQDYTLEEVVESFNKAFGTSLKHYNIQRIIRKYGLQKHLNPELCEVERLQELEQLNYTPEQLTFIEEHQPIHGFKDLQNIFNRTFDTRYQMDEIEHLVRIVTEKMIKKLPKSSVDWAALHRPKRRTYREYPKEWEMVVTLSSLPFESWTCDQRQQIKKIQALFGFTDEPITNNR